MSLPYLLPLTLFPFALIFAAFSDLFTMRISNKVSLALVVGFFIAAFLKGLSLENVMMHCGAAFVVLCLTLYCFARGHMGGADAKLAPSIVLWLGPTFVMPYLLLVAILGGVLAIFLLYIRDYPLPDFMARQTWIQRLHGQTTDIPYGINLALAALYLFLSSLWLK